MASCSQCGLVPRHVGGIRKFVDVEVDAAIRKLEGHSEMGHTRLFVAQVASEYAVMKALSYLCVDFGSADTLVKLCPELGPAGLQKLSEEGMESVLSTFTRCTPCEPLEADKFNEKDWLELRKHACECIACQQKPLHMRLYPNGECAEIDGTDRQNDPTKESICVLMWKCLRRLILAKYLSLAFELHDESDERLTEIKRDLPVEQRRIRAQSKANQSKRCAKARIIHPIGSRALRFKVGDEIAYNDDFEDIWLRGRITKLAYREFGWPTGVVAPYQVELRSGRKCYAQQDVDDTIRSASIPWPGQRVRLVRLQTASLNGLLGTVKPDPVNVAEWQELKAKGRIPVEVDTVGPKSLKSENLEVVRDGAADDPEVLQLDPLIRTQICRGELPIVIKVTALHDARWSGQKFQCMSCSSHDAFEYVALEHGLLCVSCLVDVAANMAIAPTNDGVASFLEDYCVTLDDYFATVTNIDAFDGEWALRGRISGNTYKSYQGDEHELKRLSPTECQLYLRGSMYVGSLKDDGKIYWSDGDVWSREPPK